MIRVTHKGSFHNSELFFNNATHLNRRLRRIFEKYGARGVEALRAATPKDSGETADSWYYTIENWGVGFNNSNINQGYSVALLIQYGHGVKGGGYVQGIDFINPALKPIFEQIANECWREVTNL